MDQWQRDLPRRPWNGSGRIRTSGWRSRTRCYPGLYLIVQPNGKKSWAERYRDEGQTRKYTIGSFAAVGLAVVRTQAREALDVWANLLARILNPAAGAAKDSWRLSERLPDDLRAELPTLIAQFEAALRPATEEEVGVIFGRLAMHFPPPELPEGDHELAFAIYCR